MAFHCRNSDARPTPATIPMHSIVRRPSCRTALSCRRPPLGPNAVGRRPPGPTLSCCAVARRDLPCRAMPPPGPDTGRRSPPGSDVGHRPASPSSAAQPPPKVLGGNEPVILEHCAHHPPASTPAALYLALLLAVVIVH
jgi:hypothetical protein